MRPRSIVSATLAASVFVLGPAKAQDDAGNTEAVDAAGAKVPPTLAKLLSASEADRPKALRAYLEYQIGTGQQYAGQYAALRELRDFAKQQLAEWLVSLPSGLPGSTDLHEACILALRDLHVDSAPERTMSALETIVAEVHGPSVAEAATYALAQFGDRSRVDAKLDEADKLVKSENPRLRWEGLVTTAYIHYGLREFDKGADFYKRFMDLWTSGAVEPPPRGFSGFWYNCACHHALAGRIDRGFAYLEQGLRAGITDGYPLDTKLLETDMHIARLRKDPRFPKLVERYFGNKRTDGGTKRDR